MWASSKVSGDPTVQIRLGSKALVGKPHLYMGSLFEWRGFLVWVVLRINNPSTLNPCGSNMSHSLNS